MSTLISVFFFFLVSICLGSGYGPTGISGPLLSAICSLAELLLPREFPFLRRPRVIARARQVFFLRSRFPGGWYLFGLVAGFFAGMVVVVDSIMCGIIGWPRFCRFEGLGLDVGAAGAGVGTVTTPLASPSSSVPVHGSDFS